MNQRLSWQYDSVSSPHLADTRPAMCVLAKYLLGQNGMTFCNGDINYEMEHISWRFSGDNKSVSDF